MKKLITTTFLLIAISAMSQMNRYDECDYIRKRKDQDKEVLVTSKISLNRRGMRVYKTSDDKYTAEFIFKRSKLSTGVNEVTLHFTDSTTMKLPVHGYTQLHAFRYRHLMFCELNDEQLYVLADKWIECISFLDREFHPFAHEFSDFRQQIECMHGKRN